MIQQHLGIQIMYQFVIQLRRDVNEELVANWGEMNMDTIVEQD